MSSTVSRKGASKAMDIIDIDPSTGRRVAFSRDAGMPPVRRKKPWSKVRAAQFKNDTVKFGHQNKPLSGKQRGILSALAAQAFKFLGVKGWTLDEWRQNEAVACCRYRISEAPAKMYKKLESHFAALAGDVGRSVRAAAQSSPQAQRHGSLMFLISKELCKLPRLSHEDVEDPPKGTPRKSAWAWADTIATRMFGGPCRNVDVNALGRLHRLIKDEVGNERRLAKMLNQKAKAEKKAAKEAKKKEPRAKVTKSKDGKAAKLEYISPLALNACRCGCHEPVVEPSRISCPACNRSIEGEDFSKVAARWNKGGQAV